MGDDKQVKPPHFTEADPEGYFLEFERICRNNKCEDAQKKLDVLCGRLTHEQKVCCGPAWRSAQPEEQYAQLKAALIDRYALTPAEKFRRLDNLPPLGKDERPSDRFEQMCLLANKELIQNQEYLKHLFQRCLPPAMLLALQYADNEKTTAREYAKEANKVARLLALAQTTQVSQVSEVSAIRTKSTRTAPTLSESGLCFYHNKFGDKARKCELPNCKMAGIPLAPRPNKAGNAKASQ